MKNPTDKHGYDAFPSEKGGREEQPIILPLRSGDPAMRISVRSVLSPKSVDRKAELQRRRKTEESNLKLSLHDFDVGTLWRLNGGDDEHAEPKPLTRSMLMHSTGEQAVVLSLKDRNIVRRLTFIDCYGRKISVDLREDVPEDETLILFPEELGDTAGKPSLRIVG